MIKGKGRLLYLFTVFCLLASAFVTQPAQVYAQGWRSFSADADGDGLPNDIETAGWCNLVGCFQTDPLDPDHDDDGLTDGQEKLYDTHPLDDHSPGIYVEYEDHLKTRQYFARDSHSDPDWGWQQHGSRFISLGAVVVRRGATFSVGGPAGATIEVVKSLSSLTTLTPERDACAARWRISVPTSGTVGKYEITLQEPGWSETLDLYVIFELPTPTSSLTQAMIDTFLYDDDPDNLRDERGINLGDSKYTRSDYTWIPSGAWINVGSGYRFTLQQFEPFVFEEHVIEAINGSNNQLDAADDLVAHADKVTRFDYPLPRFNSWSVLHPGADDWNQCSNIAGLLTAFERSAGIPARPFFTDWVNSSFDHSTEIWLNGTWKSARGYKIVEPECGWNCEYGHWTAHSRSWWGQNRYRPWHSGGTGNSSTIMAADENWTWAGTNWTEDPSKHDDRWPSWDWDAIVRNLWFDTLFVPYWSYWGWSQEPQVTGDPPSDWPAVTNFAIDVSPNSQTVARGESTSYTVSLSTSDGFSNRVDLSIVSGLPAGTTFSFQPDNYCVPNCSRTLVMTPAFTTPLGTHHPTIRGYSGGLDRRETVDLVVTAPPDFDISAAPPSRTVAPSGSVSYTVSLEALNGFADVVNLSVTGLPISTTADFDPDSCVPDCSSTLSVTTSGTPTGTHATLTIHGNSGALHHQTTVDLDVAEGGALGGQATSGPSLVATSPPVGAMSDGGQAGLTVRGLQDYGLDLDGDGYFDQLVVEIEANAPQAGTYWIRGQLGADHHVPSLMGTGGLIAVAVVRADLTEGTNTIQLPFEGLRLSAAKVDGLYVLQYLSITDVEDPGPDEFVNNALGQWSALYTTAAYRAVDFQNRGAALSSEITEEGLDADGDGLYETLTLNVGLNIFSPGTYTVQGDLYDGMERFVTQAAWTGTDSTASLHFEELAGTRGPYTLENVYLLNASDEIIDSMFKAYTTQQVIEAESKTHIIDRADLGEIRPQAILPGGYSDSGLDLDGDGLYDQLVINVEVEVTAANLYRLEGWLESEDSSLISWASSDPVALSVGTHSLSLAFSGPAIHAHSTDGPFTLMALKLIRGGAGGYGTGDIDDEVDVAYTTAAYTHDQFEGGASASGAPVVFEDDMESGSSQWTWESPWTRMTATSRSPIYSWADSPNDNYGNNVDVWLRTKSIDMSGMELTKAVVLFQGCYDLKANDYGYVEIQVNGGDWNTVLTFTDGTKLWYSEEAKLDSDDEITSLRARFRLASDGSETADGWYIDDVIIMGGKGASIYLPLIMK